MSREWQPGDVAMVRVFTTAGHPQQGDAFLGFYDGREWLRADGGPSTARVGWPWELEARPLVVIDPEDREQVERLTKLVTGLASPFAVRTTDMQAALREFADPKPPCGASLTLGKDAALYRCSEASRHKGPHADGTCVWTAKS